MEQRDFVGEAKKCDCGLTMANKNTFRFVIVINCASSTCSLEPDC